MERRKSKQVMVGGVPVGGGAPVTVQSMLNVPSTDIPGSVAQAKRLEEAGCQILRAAIPDHAAVALIPAIKEAVRIPLVADIHFDYKLALEAVAAGVDKVRINPGNIGDDSKVEAVAKACREKGVPIRVGVNSGSVEKHILAKFGGPTPQALVESALYHVSLLERYDFTDIVVSLKASSVDSTIRAYQLMAQRCPYPLHLGVTEAGTARMGIIKSAIGIGSLLQQGIGGHPSGVSHRRPGGGDPRGEGYFKGPGHGDRPQAGVLPHLRPHPHRPGGAGQPGGAGPQGLREGHHRGGDGLRRQRAGRGPGGGPGHRRRRG